MASAEAYQNDLDYYWATGHARIARVGDKYGYDYRAHLLETNAWANYTLGHRRFLAGRLRIGRLLEHVPRGHVAQGPVPQRFERRFEETRLPDLRCETCDWAYTLLGSACRSRPMWPTCSRRPSSATAFVSPRTRNTTTPGLKAEKVFGADLTYNLNLP